MKRRLLLVEDEPALVMTLTDRLQAEGYEVESSPDGDSALACAVQRPFDLILLDVMLPGLSGFEVCRRLRQSGIQTPILMLTARGQVADRVAGLQLGADDYLVKPFDMAELVARLQALLRRAAIPGASPVHEFGSIRVDLRSAEVSRCGELVVLSAREFELLRYLLEHRGALISREQLLQDVWGYQPALSTRTVDVHMAWLRQKLEDNPKNPRYLLTVRGLGYKFAG
jgi:two-component system alkaline phosphatase synthesis response regulator PhoP